MRLSVAWELVLIRNSLGVILLSPSLPAPASCGKRKLRVGPNTSGAGSPSGGFRLYVLLRKRLRYFALLHALVKFKPPHSGITKNLCPNTPITLVPSAAASAFIC